MNNQKGFATVLILSLLPFLIALVTGLYVMIGWLEGRSERLNHCRRTLLKGLEQVALPLDGLLALNPRAIQLRVELSLALQKLAVATASGNLPAIAAAQLQVTKVRMRQVSLDQQQKTLLKSAQLLLNSFPLRVQTHLAASSYGFVAHRQFRRLQMRLAIRPDAPTLAPIYELEEPFELKQAVAFEWQDHFQLRGPLGHFLKAGGQKREVCAVTLSKGQDRWRSKLIEDKF